MSVHRRARTSRQSSNPQKSKKNAALRQAALTACPTSGFEPLERRQLMTLVQPAGQDYLAFEAEDPQATFTDLGDADTVTWERISGAAAYGTLSAPIGGAAIIANRPAGGTANDAGSASYPIQLTNAGPYFFYARVKYTSSPGNDNSMYLPPDGGNINADATAQWDNRADSLDNYHWNNLDVNGVSFDFTNPTPGAPTTLKMNIREQNYMVDRIILSEVARTPAELDAISPAAPQAASATTKGPEANTVTITFTPVVDATGYNVYRSTNPTPGS